MLHELYLDIKTIYQSSPIWLRRYYWGATCFVSACFFWWYSPCIAYFRLDHLPAYLSLIDDVYTPSVCMALVATAFTVVNFYFHKRRMASHILKSRKILIWLMVATTCYLANDYYTQWKTNKVEQQETRAAVEFSLKLMKLQNIKDEISLGLAVAAFQLQEQLGNFDPSSLPKITWVDVFTAPDFIFSKFGITKSEYRYLENRSAQTIPGLAILLYALGIFNFYMGIKFAKFFVPENNI